MSAKGSPPEAEAGVSGGNYEVIRRRLTEQGRQLRERADALNERRKSVFGSTELSLLGQGRVRTENTCTPVGICQVGGRLLFGFNVFLGLRKDVAVADVLSLHAFDTTSDGFDFPSLPPDDPLGASLLGGSLFLREFAELHQYYRDARLRMLRPLTGKLLAVMQVGRAESDLRVFRWSLSPGRVDYVDNRGERDHAFPAAFDFSWTRTSAEAHVAGRHPHVSIEDEIFVETIGGDLTIKVENNTQTGKGIFSDPVEDKNQSLDDAEISYARVGGLLLLKVLPFQESRHRYLVYNPRTSTVVRIDAIGLGCLSLPEDQGLIFPGGVYLSSGEHKLFDGDMEGLAIERVVRSPNGEDVLYVFYRSRDGAYLLLPYNLIRKAVSSPILCHGYTLFDDGRLVFFRAMPEATRVHPMLVWQTPFISDEFAAARPADGSFLGRLGNPELVRGLSECLALCRSIDEQVISRPVYEHIISAATRIRDTLPWMGSPEAGDLLSVIDEIRRATELVLDEFEKVLALRASAAAALDGAKEQQAALIKTLNIEDYRAVDQHMAALASLRQQRGQLISLREQRFIDTAAIDGLEREVIAEFERVSLGVVGFLSAPDALAPVRASLESLANRAPEARNTADFEPLTEESTKLGQGLDLISEIVGGLSVGDAVTRARILEEISEVYGLLNRARAILSTRRNEVRHAEARAEFGAQYKLLGQSVASALALCDTPERCDEQLSRLLLSMEELEGRFGEIEEFSTSLATRREELVEAIGSRKQGLLDERQRRVGSLMSAAERILDGLSRRVRGIKSEDELNATFAADPMVLKLRQLADQLKSLSDSIKADEVLGRLKVTRQTALRALRDRLDLFEGDEALIRFGRFRFSVNTQPVALTLIPREGALALHLTGTDLYLPVTDPEFEAARPLWDQVVLSETAEVYRAEYLAASLLFAAEAGTGLSVQTLSAAALRDGGLLELVRAEASNRFDEGYERGIHDHDAALILDQLLRLRGSAGLLRFPALPRAAALLFWAQNQDKAAREVWSRSARSLGRLRARLGTSPAAIRLGADLAARVDAHAQTLRIPELEAWNTESAALAGAYLVEELSADSPRFVLSPDAQTLSAALQQHLQDTNQRAGFDEDLAALDRHPADKLALARAWLAALVGFSSGLSPDAITEAAAALICARDLDFAPSTALTSARVGNLLGTHPRVRDRALDLRLDELLSRLDRYRQQRVPAFRAWRSRRTALLELEHERLRLDEFKPRIMSAFVRNQLINEVYLPLIGANLAKQIGAEGEGRRTDQMGLLLLISPPGYGKTTLMEYVASQLGLVFMKINGPALGHGVHSLDPAEAPNATSRAEVEKINLALQMGNNVMLYLDDIQHTHPELLQKFISLCDAQRKIEGVWRGSTRTYDLRGKKFCVVMAGNPYTESGEKFQIPDMLANRADTYNLGDILDGRKDAFALSYIENTLTSNPALSPLAARPSGDLYRLIRMAAGEDVPSSELSHEYAASEIAEITGVLRHLQRVQRVLLLVNLEYIRSASTADSYRTEPPFKLQGSYRNMNKMAEKVFAAMTDDEVERLIDDHYAGESQTLTSGAEQNLLKLAELRGRMSETQQARWSEIKRSFARILSMGGDDADPVTRVTGTISGLSQQLEGIRGTLAEAGGARGLESRLDRIGEGMEGLRAALDPIANQRIDQPVRVIASQLAGLRTIIAEGKGAGPVEARLASISGDLSGLVKAIEAATRGLAALNLTDWLLPAIEHLQSEPDVARLRTAMVESATAGLADPAAPRVERRDIALASALPVIHDLAVQIHALAGSHLDDAQRERFMSDLRVEFARVVSALSHLEPEAGATPQDWLK